MSVQEKNNRGFTLIEIQVALLLLVLILGLLSGALYLASKSWKTGQARNEMIDEQRLITDFLRKQISHIMPLLWVDTRSLDLIFRGKSDSMLFVGKLPEAGRSGLPALIQLTTHNDHSGKYIEYGYAPLSPDKTPFDTSGDRMQSTRLLNNIKSIQFEYFGRQNEGGKPPEWHDNWTSRKLLPQLIKCRIITNNETIWPEMIFPLNIDNSSGLRQFFLQKSTTYQYNSSGDSSGENKGPTIDSDGFENSEKLEELF